MRYYQLLIFLCIILCTNSNFTTTTDILNNEPVSIDEKNVTKIFFTINSTEDSSIETSTEGTDKLSSDPFELRKQEAIKIIQNMTLEQLEILAEIIDDYLKSKSTTLKKSTITTTYSLSTLAIPSSTLKTKTTTKIFLTPIEITVCIAVFSVLILTLIGIIIYMVIINDLRIVLCGKIIRERTKTKQIKV